MERRELLVQRVKNSLNVQSYTMNDSWLLECIEFYLEDHQNPELEEVSNFVINQWLLSDLREVNNENGCLPRNLANQKRTSLTGKYILQMDKIYDISMSKYKQIEKIRNVSSENVEATENENVNQEDKFQAWEPKSKRMLQLFLTDGVQDILAIEYKPIRFLKDTLYPGYKLMIKGPVDCRRGVILLEENNIKEMGGEVDSLLITNAVENIFARALKLEENPDPYNDNNQNHDSQNNQNTLNNQINDDFDIDSEMIEQIDKQIQEHNPVSTHISSSTRNNDQKQFVCTAMNTLQKQNSISSTRIQNSIAPITNNDQVKTKTSMSENKTPTYKNRSEANKFEDDDDDSYLDTIDETSLNYSLPKSSSLVSSKYVPISKQPSSSSSRVVLQCSQEDEFPMENEIHDLTDQHSPFFNSEKVQSKLPINTCISLSKPSSWEKQVQTNTSKKISSDSNNRKTTSELPSPLKTHLSSNSKNNDFEFPDDDGLNELNLDANDFKDSFGNDNKNIASLKLTRTPSTTLSKYSDPRTDEKSSCPYANKKSTNLSNGYVNEAESSLKNLESKIDDELNIEFESKMEMDYEPFEPKFNRSQESTIEGLSKNSIKSQFGISKSNFTAETTGVKRLASERSPNTDAPQKVRCLQNTSKSDKAADRKITEYLSKNLLNENTLKICEFLSEVLERPVTYEGHRALVRGKVINVVKLNLHKNENGPYFHLEGKITDGTASTDVVFSSEVLEKIIGYSPQEFTQKRKQCKVNPSMKDQLREDLLKAQQSLKFMDVLMELIFKTGHKPLIVNTCKLTQKEINDLDKKAKQFKKNQ